MNEYIKLTDLWSEPFDYIIDSCGSSVAQGFVDRVNKIPVESMEKVIQCKDCAVPHNRWTGCPKLGGLVPPPDFYCAFGTTDKT